MSAVTIHLVALGLHALALCAAVGFGQVTARNPADRESAGALFGLAIILALAGFALQVAA